MDRIKIRIAKADDAEFIADLSRRTFYDAFAQYNTKENMDLFMERQFSREQLIAEVGTPGTIFLLAELDGHPVGYVKLASSQPPEGLPAGADMEIVRIYSEQHTIGKGVGRALMQASIHQAREQGKPWIWLGVWEHNQRAIDFYRKWGFEKFGEHVFMVGEDPQTDWWMKKKV